jgi:hypothetical protein
VSTTFLIQNQYYSSQILATAAHDNARAAAELMASEIRSVMASGITVAGARTLTIRTPMVLATVCNVTGTGNGADVYKDGGEQALDTAEVAGIAIRDATTGAWTYANATWSTLNGTVGSPADRCADAGADTVGAYDDHHRLRGLLATIGAPVVSDLLMLFRETTFQFLTSEMDSTTVGLFRKPYGHDAVEYATGMDTTSQFHYRVGASYGDTLPSSFLPFVDVVRIVVEARKRSETGGVDDVMFGWSVNIALRNLRQD